MTSFVKRQLGFVFSYGNGPADEIPPSGPPTTATVAPGLRASLTIDKAAAEAQSTLQATIYGLDPKILAGISTLGTTRGTTRNNKITVSAGDATSGMSTAFIGTIDVAWSDYSDPANPKAIIHAYTGLWEAQAPVSGTSFKGASNVADIISAVVGKMPGWTFESNGVNVILRNQHLSGTAVEQIQTAARAANINLIFDDQPGGLTVAIWPQSGSGRTAATPTIISPDSGMVGYPQWVDNAIEVKSIYNPSLSAGDIGTTGALVGGEIQIQDSIVANANGPWRVFGVTHELETEIPGGAWFTTVRAINLAGIRAPGT